VLKASGASRFDKCPACGRDNQVGAWDLLVRPFGGIQGRIRVANQHEGRHGEGGQLFRGKGLHEHRPNGMGIAPGVEVEEHLAQTLAGRGGGLGLGAEVGVGRDDIVRHRRHALRLCQFDGLLRMARMAADIDSPDAEAESMINSAATRSG
jgi:hypothetical protein